MIALARMNFGCLISKHSSSLCKSHASLSLLLHNFATSPEREAASTTAVYDVLVNKHHFSPEIASAAAVDLSRFRSPEKADSILSFLEENCFSSSQLERIVKTEPRILTASVEDDIKLKIKIFKDFGFLPEDIAKITSSNHAILHSSLEKKIIPQLSTLKGLLGSNHEVVGLVKRASWYMTANLEKSFVPNLEFLKSSGVSMEDIRTLLYNFPRCLLVKPDIMRRSVEKAKEIGVNQSSKAFVYAVRVIASLREDTWELKLQGFKDLGVSESDVLGMFRKSPFVLCTSLEKIQGIKKLLLATGRYDICDIVNDPLTLSCSIEMKYKPRLRILEILDSRKLIEKWPSLSKICRLSHGRFFETFVRPYSDHLGEVCIAEDSLKSKERRRRSKK